MSDNIKNNNEINSTLSFLNNLPAYYKMSFKMTHIVFQQQLLFTEHQMPLNIKFPERTSPADTSNSNNNKESKSSSNNKSNTNSSKKAKAKPKKTTSTSTTTTIATALSELDELNGAASGSSQFEQYEVELTTMAEPTVDKTAAASIDISSSQSSSSSSSSSSSQSSIYSYSSPSIYLGQVSFVDNRLNLPLFNSLVKTTFGKLSIYH